MPIAGNFGRGVGGPGGDGHPGCRGLWEGRACSGRPREMENIRRGPTFEDFVTIRSESSMLDVTVASTRLLGGTVWSRGVL
jgi:hypothetical protein